MVINQLIPLMEGECPDSNRLDKGEDVIYTDNIHLVADTLQELHAFCGKIGLKRCWFEGVKKKHPHYDLVNEKGFPLINKNGDKFMDVVIKEGAQLVSDRKVLAVSKKLCKPSKQSKLF